VTISVESREPRLSAGIFNNRTPASLDELIRIKRKINVSEHGKWVEGRLGEVKADLEESDNELEESVREILTVRS